MTMTPPQPSDAALTAALTISPSIIALGGKTSWDHVVQAFARFERDILTRNLASTASAGLVEILYRRLRDGDDAKDGWTDAGMEDAFFRWPVIERELRAALSTPSTQAASAGLVEARWTHVRTNPPVGGKYLVGGYYTHGSLGRTFGTTFATVILLDGPENARPEWSYCAQSDTDIPIQYWARIPAHPEYKPTPAQPAAQNDAVREALEQLYSFVAIMVGVGPEARIPETISTPIGLPVKIGDIMRAANAALATPPAPVKGVDLADELQEAIDVHRGHCVNYVSFDFDLADRILTALRATAAPARAPDGGELEEWRDIRDDPDAIVKCGDRWEALAAKIGCSLRGFNDGKSASFYTPDGRSIEIGPKFRQFLAALSPSQPDGEVVKLLRAVRACRSDAETVESVHGPVEVGPRWSISSLSALLPRIDTAISRIEGAGELGPEGGEG